MLERGNNNDDIASRQCHQLSHGHPQSHAHRAGEDIVFTGRNLRCRPSGRRDGATTGPPLMVLAPGCRFVGCTGG